jgi:hypothetical protein
MIETIFGAMADAAHWEQVALLRHSRTHPANHAPGAQVSCFFARERKAYKQCAGKGS